MPATYCRACARHQGGRQAAVGAAIAGLPYRPALLVAEPGRFLVAESSVLVATVIGVAAAAPICGRTSTSAASTA